MVLLSFVMILISLVNALYLHFCFWCAVFLNIGLEENTNIQYEEEKWFLVMERIMLYN